MLHRRAFLSLSVLAAGALVGSTSADARKVRPNVELYFGAELTQPEPGAITIQRYGHPALARLIERVLPAKVEIVSETNDNSRFSVRFEMPRRSDPMSVDNRRPLARYFLRTATTWRWPTGAGRSETSESAMFDLDRDSAILVSQQLGAPLQERTPLDKDVDYTFTVQPTAKLGAPITIEMKLDNHGSDAVASALHPGSFWFQVTHDDGTVLSRRNPRRLPVGSTPYSKLPPGGKLSLVTDLHDHVILDRPGTYQITATYRGALVEADRTSHAVRWDVTRTFSATVVVR